MTNKKIAIIQPIVPHYRLDFFNELILSNHEKYEIKVFASNKDFTGLKSCEQISECDFFIKLGDFLSIKNKLFWQKKLKFNIINEYDVIVISGNPRVLNHMLMFLLCKLYKKKVIWWGQGWTANSRGFFAKLRRRIMDFSDGLIVYTDAESSEFESHPNVIGLNNGLNIEKIQKEVECIEFVSSTDDCLRLCFIGRLTEKSKLLLLFNALKNVSRKTVLNIIGDGLLKQELKDFYEKELSKNKNVTVLFYGELFNEVEIGNVFSQSDAFIYPGSVGLSLIHSFAHGLPALVHGNKESHMPEYSAFINGYNGFNIPTNDVELGVFINNLDISKLQLMRNNALNTVKNDFNIKSMSQKFCKVIDRL